MKELDVKEYVLQSAGYDAEILRLKAPAVGDCGKNTAHIQEIAEKIVAETNLTQAISDALIEKVFSYPDNRIEVTWKIPGFLENTALERDKKLSA